MSESDGMGNRLEVESVGVVSFILCNWPDRVQSVEQEESVGGVTVKTRVILTQEASGGGK